MSKKIVIAIGREFGSGGREIARKVAEKLGIKIYDKELIALIAKNSGMSEEVLHDVDETATNSFLYALSSGAFSGAPIVNSGSAMLPVNDKAFIACSKIIKELAEKEGVTEQLKSADQMAWVQRLNNIREQAAEVVNA